MDKDRAQGKLEDMKGRIKHQAGEWTGNKKQQAEGAAEQVKGKAQNAWGKVKDAGRELANRAEQAKAEHRRKVEQKRDDSAA